MNLLGIDNVFFEVKDLQSAITFYEKIGFKQKQLIPQLNAVLFSIGEEEPGLIICEKNSPIPSKLWVEVEDAIQQKKHIQSLGISGRDISTKTGVAFEIVDDSGNCIGFADYSRDHHLSRKNKNTIRSIAIDYSERVWNKKDLSAISDYFNDFTIIHSLLGDFQGAHAMKEVVQIWLKGFPDLLIKNELIIAENDLVSMQWSVKGTHQGEFKGRKPTGKPVSYRVVTVYRIKNGQIVEYWAYLDMQNLLSQIE